MRATLRAHKKTLAEMFCETYVQEGTKCSYIMMPKLLTDRVLGECRESLLSPEARKSNLTEVEGVPAYRVRKRFVKNMLKCKDDPIGLVHALRYVFTDDAMKALFSCPNIWLLCHNAKARKARYQEECEERHQMRVNKEACVLHRQCVDRTRNVSVRSASVEIRNMGRSA